MWYRHTDTQTLDITIQSNILYIQSIIQSSQYIHHVARTVVYVLCGSQEDLCVAHVGRKLTVRPGSRATSDGAG
jgi:hypothetical protein